MLPCCINLRNLYLLQHFQSIFHVESQILTPKQNGSNCTKMNTWLQLTSAFVRGILMYEPDISLYEMPDRRVTGNKW